MSCFVGFCPCMFRLYRYSHGLDPCKFWRLHDHTLPVPFASAPTSFVPVSFVLLQHFHQFADHISIKIAGPGFSYVYLHTEYSKSNNKLASKKSSHQGQIKNILFIFKLETWRSRDENETGQGVDIETFMDPKWYLFQEQVQNLDG